MKIAVVTAAARILLAARVVLPSAANVLSGIVYDNGTTGTLLVPTAAQNASAVWEEPTSSHTTSGSFGHNTLRSDVAGVAGTVSLWTGGAYSRVFADTYRIDEDYNAAIALKNILTGVGSTITGDIDGNVTGSVQFIVDDVTLSAGTQASIANSVWSTDVSSYTSPSAGYDLSNATAGGGITAGDVWSYATREITGGIADTVITLTNKAGFAITGGTITTNSDKTGYSLSQSFPANFSSLSITGGKVSVIQTDLDYVINNIPQANYTNIAAANWNYLLSGIAITGSIGYIIKTNLDTTISSRSTLTSNQVLQSVQNSTKSTTTVSQEIFSKLPFYECKST